MAPEKSFTQLGEMLEESFDQPQIQIQKPQVDTQVQTS